MARRPAGLRSRLSSLARSNAVREPTITIDRVVAACGSLPEPAWHRILDHPEPRMAATLIPVVDVGGRAAVVVTKRAGDLDHGGDWVFPGGRVDDADASHRDAARREAAEELGVEPAHIDVIGQLATRGPIISGYVIESYVGVLDTNAVLAPHAGEVADVAVVPIDDLLAPDGHRRGPALVPRITPEQAEHIAVHADLGNLRQYKVGEGEYLWGLQADILHELLSHVTDGGHDF
jgi:8-oxo-dGTP pyrophosphatase MutT (NUDIX family)